MWEWLTKLLEAQQEKPDLRELEQRRKESIAHFMGSSPADAVYSLGEKDDLGAPREQANYIRQAQRLTDPDE